MKRIFIISFSLIVFSNLFAQDLCLEKIKDGISKYNAGKYIEAQQAFISVAQACGNYGDVYTKLRNCNDKIKQQQTANRTEISSLKTQNKSLSEQLSSLKSEHSELLRVSASKVATLEGQVTKTKEQLEKTNSNLASANSTIVGLRKDTASLHLQLDSLINRADSLQNSLNKQQHRSGVIVRDNKDKNKENMDQEQDSVKSTALPIIKK